MDGRGPLNPPSRVVDYLQRYGQRRSLSPTLGTNPRIPTEPSLEYLALADTPSRRLSDPSESRKLLILDLNGTLVYRSPHTPRSQRPAGRYMGGGGRGGGGGGYGSTGYEDPYKNSVRPLRPVYARPYMPSFVQYLFHPKTRTWLDTMVWSSAQPHSVDDMVGRCFGELKRELLAVWARDTLGLLNHEYNRKTQTTKDLAKPWGLLPAYSLSEGEERRHSAESTLLLDDSPKKAHLQPWNHLCIREYVGDMRRADLELAVHEATEAMRNANREAAAAVHQGTSNDSDTLDKKRKRDKKKKAAAPPTGPSHQYDPTLLAIVGVLDAIHNESNVAAWLKKGGLWGIKKVDESVALTSGDANEGVIVESPTEKTQLEVEEGSQILESDLSGKRRRLSTPEPETQPLLATFAAEAPISAPKTVEALAGTTPHMWFEDEDNIDYWVLRGIQALDALRISIDHGVSFGPGVVPDYEIGIGTDY